MKIVVDAENSIAGRLSSFVVKQALQGKEVSVVNSEKAFIIGNKADIIEKFVIQRQRGKSQRQKGPHPPSSPDRMLKRIMRGMMKYKEGRGKIAFKKIKCYIGVPSEFQNSEKISVFKIDEGKRGMNLNQLAGLLRGK